MGRALGIAGYDACNNIASADEVSSAINQQSSLSSAPRPAPSLSRNPAPQPAASQSPGGAVVSSVEKKELTNRDGEPFDKWIITLTDGTKLTTFKQHVGQAASEGDQVEFDAGPPNNYGDRPLRWLKKVAAPAAPPADRIPEASNF